MTSPSLPDPIDLPDLPVAARSAVPRAAQAFLHTEAAGGVFLLAGALIALLWVNGPWSESYRTLWSTEIDLRMGTIGFHGDLHAFVNDGLMAVFFFVVGLEIKRELVVGELRRWRTASLPVFAALGGMVVPAVIYVTLNAGSAGSGGWAIPMATDIAFAVGVLSLLGSRVPPSLKVFLLTLAIVDDIGSIVVIAVFYADAIHLDALGVAALVLLAMGLLRWLRFTWLPLYFVGGIAVWLAVHESGVHATIAGVVLGLLAPARPQTPAAVAAEWAQDLSDDPSPRDLRVMARLARSSVSLAERLQVDLHPLTSFVIVPLFALANAGIELDAGSVEGKAAGLVAVGVMVGLVVGKVAGITLLSFVAVRLGLGELPDGTRWPHVVGVGALGGIGFTVSIFVTGLAFDDAGLVAAAKLGILGASVAASILGAIVLMVVSADRARSDQR